MDKMITRSLVRAPAFAATAILTLALGIGLSTAVFTVADALLLRSLPVRAQNDLVMLWAAKRDGSLDHWPLGISDVRAYSARTRAFQDVAFADYYGALPIPIVDGGVVTRLRGALVSGNYFDVIGARALVGRTLRPSDDVVGAAPVVVINHATWQRRFGGDPNAIGKRITLQVDGVAYTIVGVMPQGLEYPAGVDFWAPYAPTRLRTAKDSGFAMLDLVGRLAPGATPANAETELTTYLARADASPWSRDLRGTAHSFTRVILGNARPAVIVVAAAAVLLLLITCINVANLLLVRGLARVREFAVRSALGATRSQVVLHLLAENALLALVSGALGVLVAAAGVHSFLNFARAGIPLVETVRLDTTALAGAFGITAFAMLLFGLAPALVTARVDLQNVLRAGTRQSAGRRSRLVREMLVGIQVALAVLVLSAAALIGRSFIRLQNADLAFESSHLLVAELGLRYDVYDSLDKQLTMLRALLTQVRAMPGVRNVSPVVAVPFSGVDGWSGHATADGQTVDDAAKNPMFNMELVTPDYFETFGLHVLRGRGIADTDRQGAEPVVVISESVARHYWPGQDPIGQGLRMGDDSKRLTVVGVVPDTRYRDLREARPSVYFPLAQSVFPFAPTTLAIRTTGTPATIVPAIRRVIAETAPGVSLASAAPFETYMQTPLAQPRLNAFLLVVFAMAATVLAAIGLFGAMATLVRQRAHEMGIRMALGATSRDVQFMVVSRGLGIAVAGVVTGLAGAFGVNRLLSSLLYDVSPRDPVALAGVAVLLIAIALAAAFVPALWSGRIDPAVALRAEG
jgi:putative ABC transport system permease protein